MIQPSGLGSLTKISLRFAGPFWGFRLFTLNSSNYTIVDMSTAKFWYNWIRHNRAQHLQERGSTMELQGLLSQVPVELAPWVALVIIAVNLYKQIAPLFSKPDKGDDSDNFQRGDTKG